MALRRFDIEAGGETFAFKPETEPKIDFWRAKYPADKQRSAVIPLLWLDEYDQMGQQLWSIDKLNGNVFYADDFDGTSASVSKRAIDWCAGNGAIKTHEPDLNFLIGAH